MTLGKHDHRQYREFIFVDQRVVVVWKIFPKISIIFGGRRMWNRSTSECMGLLHYSDFCCFSWITFVVNIDSRWYWALLWIQIWYSVILSTMDVIPSLTRVGTSSSPSRRDSVQLQLIGFLSMFVREQSHYCGGCYWYIWLFWVRYVNSRSYLSECTSLIMPSQWLQVRIYDIWGLDFWSFPNWIQYCFFASLLICRQPLEYTDLLVDLQS